MGRSNYLFTSESVSEGHPDKVCDRISDAVVDAYLAAEPEARVACETLATTNRVVIAGEVRGPASITKDTVVELAREAIRDIGYEQDGFHWKNADVAVYLHAQSAHIAQGVDASGNKDEGAGDQGNVRGLAVEVVLEAGRLPVEAVLLVADALHHVAHGLLDLVAHTRRPAVGVGKLLLVIRAATTNLAADDDALRRH